MPTPFLKVTLEQFAGLLERFPFTRSITEVHMHHSWRPSHRSFDGDASMAAMRQDHTARHGWPDLAQHITIGPQGDIWLGRNWNTPPASISGKNGSDKAGPFMFTMIGDFDAGQDKFGGAQRDTVLEVIARVQQRFDLAPESLVFHTAMPGTSCPGNSISYASTLEAVRQTRASLAGPRRVAPFQNDASTMREAVDAAIAELLRPAGTQRASALADACRHHHAPAMAAEAKEKSTRGTLAAGARGTTLTPDQAKALRPHLVNLSMGAFSDSGEWRTSAADVDAIFGTHLPRAMQEARKEGRPLRLMFQAHGGLNDEATGLAIAQKSVAWWIANGVYPIYFTWETGLFETIGQLLQRATGGARDLADYTTDPVVQEAVRFLQAPKVWGGMKMSAQLASSKDGGAYYVARRLAAFCQAHRDEVELHAVGHSAGSIFHSWFIPCALELGAPPFRSLHLMAPAARMDLFKDKLVPRVGPGRGIDEVTIYTMKDDLEADDTCAGIYRKSLLYLIFHALEPQRKTPILGLEDSLRADTEVSHLFGLDGSASECQVVWSRTEGERGRSASRATSHGGFDDDPSTMGSIVRRILGRHDNESIVEYQGGARGALWEQWQTSATAAPLPFAAQDQGQKQSAEQIYIGARQPVRRALCVGINTYPTAPLSGCVADVEAWSSTLATAGFSVARLLDEQATRAAIIEHLERMIAGSKKGDVLVFQYSGHGTQVPDLDRDEDNGDSPGLDEAICPHDFANGAFLIDDDIGRIFKRLPDGVNLTCFMDCCHSGTISRFAVGGPLLASARDPSEHMRFIPRTRELSDAHRRFRASLPQADQGGVGRGAAPLREVVFSACLSTEVAWESNGQGEFTVRATAVLAEGMDGLSNGAFADKVSAAFGANPRQHARLYSSTQGAARALLQPLAAAPVTVKEAAQDVAAADLPLAASLDAAIDVAGLTAAVTSAVTATPAMPDLAQLIQLLQNVERLLQASQLQMPKLPGKPARKNGTHNIPSASLQHGGRQNR